MATWTNETKRGPDKIIETTEKKKEPFRKKAETNTNEKKHADTNDRAHLLSTEEINHSC